MNLKEFEKTASQDAFSAATIIKLEGFSFFCSIVFRIVFISETAIGCQSNVVLPGEQLYVAKTIHFFSMLCQL